MTTLVIAVDGTAGSGKSSTSRGTAQRLGLRYLDTGAMYRAMTYRMLRDAVDVDDPAVVAAHAGGARIESGTDPQAPTIVLDGVEVSAQIRTDEVNAAVNRISGVQRVRDLLIDQQRAVIGSGGIVVEGRDIGSVVAPEARLKVYLTADAAARAQRRSAETPAGQTRDVGAVRTALTSRDANDPTRSRSMSVAEDAVVIDTTYHSLEEIIDQMVTLARARAEESG